jgi:uncharacterized membrane protein
LERLRSILSDLHKGLWFLPSLIVGAATLLAAGMIWLDSRTEWHLGRQWPLVFGSGAEGSRGMLSTIASSVITVAGVVFSITIVALSLTASQYSPRLLRNFMADRPTQAVLGAFVAIFVYCLVVLRTIRGIDDAHPFIPSLSVLVALLLALVGIGLFVYFIHHVAVSIQVSSILERIGKETAAAIVRLYPESLPLSQPDQPEPEQPEPEPYRAEDRSPPPGNWQAVPAVRSGYVVRVDFEGWPPGPARIRRASRWLRRWAAS